ncbi:MAG: helix-turn-helix domain-containing protein [Saprospirales bacterium]|nr:helix-turn-helix domain-containing protein [Saprospirales bacterium]
MEDSQGDIWIGTNTAGVSRFDGATFTQFTEQEGLGYNRVWAMHEDSGGNIWFGTGSGGVSRFKDRSFVHFTDIQGLSNNKIRSVLEDSQGSLWFATEGDGVSKYDGKNITHFTEMEGLSNNYVFSMLEDSQGRLWFGTNQGANRFDGKSFTTFTVKEGLCGNSIWAMLEDSQGNIWFGSEGGVSCYDGNFFIQYTKNEGLNVDFIFSILEDSQCNIWFGTNGGGAIRYDGNNFTHFTTSEGLCGNEVNTIFEDSHGNLWLGTECGVCWFDGKRMTSFSQNNILLSSSISSFLEDDQGNIWISTLKGIELAIPSRVKGEQGFQLLDFEKPDGLQTTDFFPNSVCLDKKNRLLWGTAKGLTILDLNRFELPTAPPKNITVDQVKVNQHFLDYQRLEDRAYWQSLPFGKTPNPTFDSIVPFFNIPLNLTLPHQLNHLTFHFSAIDWTAPHKIKYSFFMEGLDQTWSIPQSEPEADYRNIPPGTHTLKVKAIGAAQVWSEPYEYTFTIRYPWWQTWWAYSIYGFVILTGLYALNRFWLRRKLQLAETLRLKELDQVKTRLYTNITHEFRTPLTVIQGVNEQIREAAETLESPGIIDKTQIVHRNSHTLLTLVNQMLDLRKLESGNLPVQMVQRDIIIYLNYLLESFHSLAEAKEIRLHFYSDETELVMDFDPEKIQHIISNLISNAIKFTPEGGEVFLTIKEEMERCAIRIEDTGIGIPSDQLPHIFDRFYQVDAISTRKAEGTGIGLTLTKELVKLLEGDIQVESMQGQGTSFLLWLPIRRTAPKMGTTPNLDLAGGSAGETPLPESLIPLDSVSLPLVLIIEDNKDVSNYIHSCLDAEYRSEKAYDGQQGIDKAIKLIPDLIISDVMMPEKDGFEVCRTLKKDPRTSHIPILLLTAKADIDSRLQGLECGADVYLPKPFHKTELLVQLRKLLELRETLRAYYLSLATDGRGEGQKSVPQEENEFVLRIRQKVEAHLADPTYSVDQLCQDLTMSYSQLHRKLKALTGYSANQFIRYIRLREAQRLMKENDYSIAEVAFNTGFEDPAYFSRAFKKEFGVTPTEWREG